MFLILSLIFLGVSVGASGDVKMLNLDDYNELSRRSELQVIYFKKELELNFRDDISEQEVEPGMPPYGELTSIVYTHHFAVYFVHKSRKSIKTGS